MATKLSITIPLGYSVANRATAKELGFSWEELLGSFPVPADKAVFSFGMPSIEHVELQIEFKSSNGIPVAAYRFVGRENTYHQMLGSIRVYFDRVIDDGDGERKLVFVISKKE
jgi:hypothetical protein